MARITIIDDDEDSGKLLESFLRSNNFVVRVFSDGEQFDLAHQTQTDIFIIDINLGGISGDEICRQIKSHPELRGIPVIIVSAHPEIEKIASAACADTFLIKPYSLGTLREKISSFLRNQ